MDGENLQYNYTDFKSRMDNVFSKYGSKTALKYITTSEKIVGFTFDDIRQSTAELQNELNKCGISAGDRAAVIAPHSPYSVIAEYSLAYLNITAVMIDASLPVEEINRLLEWSDVSALFVTNSICLNIDTELLNDIAVFEIYDSELPVYFRRKNKIIGKRPTVPTNRNVISVIYSSGTTGTMKGAEITYKSIVYAYKYMCGYTNLCSEITFLNVLPINHIAGYSTAFSCFFAGAEMGFVCKVDPHYLKKGFSIYNPTNFIMIPKVYDLIRNQISDEINKKSVPVRKSVWALMRISGFVRKHTGIKLKFLTKPIVKAAMGKNMVICGCGTAPCSEETAQFYLDLGIDFVNVYGSTETGFPITAANCKTTMYPVSGVGNIKQFADIYIKISDPDTDGSGEICVNSPLLMNGYFRDPQATTQSFDSDGYFKTGDIGFINNGSLYINGRGKEMILLHNGKKVSPYDVDKFYKKVCGDVEIASCGMSDKSGLYDKIYIFIETNGKTADEINEAKDKILKLSVSNNSIYNVSEVKCIDKIPCTSTGKVQRSVLAKTLSDKETVELNNRDKTNFEEYIIKLLSEKTDLSVEITNESVLATDLGIDSLTMFELCVDIEDNLKVNIANKLEKVKTVGDLIEAARSSSSVETVSTYSINDFPAAKSKGDIWLFKLFMKLSRNTYAFKVSGTENLDFSEQYIFCPNHESHFDGMWVWTAIREHIDLNKIACLAKQEHLDNSVSRKGLRLTGGIPVDRTGNSAPAMKRALEVIEGENYMFLIHPEGTRTRTGELGKFKQGAAKLSIESGVKIVPVCINGAYRIFPPNRKLPRIFDFKKFKKYPLEIEFGVPIEPNGKTAEQITDELRGQIVEMKNKETK